MSRIYFVAGEASGDTHGAALLRELRQRLPEVEMIGRGGPKMRAIAGPQFRDWIDEAAVLGLWEVLKHYRFFRDEFDRAFHEIASSKPDAVVLIDYPGFNLRLARAVRRKMPSLKITCYISPQVWAWNRRRITEMARFLDLMLCIFPFEPELYQASGLRALFVGHPMAAAFSSELTPAERDEQLVALLPGSREREVRKILPIMEAAAVCLARTHPGLRFEVGAASEPLARWIDSFLSRSSAAFSVSVGEATALMRRARVGMIASGTATLEATLARLPFVLVYRVSWLTYFAARLVVNVKHLGMPNVLAGREIVPEFIQHRARPESIASAVAALLPSGEPRRRMLHEFESITAKLGESEAAANAAEAILAEMGPRA